MIDDASRRRDEQIERILKGARRRRPEVAEMFFELIGDKLERDLTARKLVRDFFDRRDRERARQASASDPDRS
jgi:hypothetical protein